MSSQRSQFSKLGHTPCEDEHEPANFLVPPTDAPEGFATDAGGEETQGLDQPIGASSLQGLSDFSSLGKVGQQQQQQQQHGFGDFSELPFDPTAARPLQVESTQNVDQGQVLCTPSLVLSNTLNYGPCVLEATTLVPDSKISQALYVYNRGHGGLCISLALFTRGYFQFPCTLNMNGFTPWIQSFASQSRLVLDLSALVAPSATVNLAAKVTGPLTMTVKNGGWPDRILHFTTPHVFLGYTFQMNRPSDLPVVYGDETSGGGSGVADRKEGIPARTSASHPSQPFTGAAHAANNNYLHDLSSGSSSLPVWESRQPLLLPMSTLQPLTPGLAAPTLPLESSYRTPLPSSVSSMPTLSPKPSLSSMSSSMSSSSIPTAPKSPLSKLQSFSSKAAALLSPSSLEQLWRWSTMAAPSSFYYSTLSSSGSSSASTSPAPDAAMPPSLPKPTPGPPSKKRKGADESNKDRTKDANTTNNATKNTKRKGGAAVAFLKPLINAFDPQPAAHRPRTYDVATSHMTEDVPGGFRCTFVFEDGTPCNKVIARRNNCVSHYKKHDRHDPRPYKCLEGGCAKVYADQSSLDRHQRNKHQ
ncbi:hypothetical protein EMPS_02729 [Entomortierella parvispora]|uniref:C2H2-type domain-containing protein n=1 Tax=Entomortierella parvispora TaxID=205924 RepID=A0A9P3H595_9FUNG|nr:hypothetical protein EMPS_02729 [Entomortierella parvispora]